MKLTSILVCAGAIMFPCTGYSQAELPSYSFTGGYGQVEVGGRYAGMEFHGSRPLPSRISFYAPVANSIDLSRDYWRRGESRPMVIGFRPGTGEKRSLGNEPWGYSLSPHAVTFRRESEGFACSIRYEFCFDNPAAVMTLTLRNISGARVPVELYTHLLLCLRTCQTYARKEMPSTEYYRTAVAAHFDDPETDSATVFVGNCGDTCSWWTTDAAEVAATDSGTSKWLSADLSGDPDRTSAGKKHRAVAAFTYRKNLGPGDSLVVVQVIGSCRRGEWKKIAGELARSWKDDVARYRQFIAGKASGDAVFTTGDSTVDRSAVWARALIAANAHYLDGRIVPMPCPAEYNFFFTHDLLLTDLGAANFDPVRVKRDLLYVAALSRQGIIPHAYYWRDDGFKTEFCTPDNWNHLWFILVTGSYLRHTMDDSTGQVLFPLVQKSVEEVLHQKHDNLMYGFRPDWWDIGHREGPRAYLTILTVRALREYLFINAALGRSSPSLVTYELCADSMQEALGGRLWNENEKYLLDRNGDTVDGHYYMGPLLAPVFAVLDGRRANALVETAGRELADPRIGVRVVMPPDFHTKESIAQYRFAGDEAGQPYYYINGGVWPHANAWYAVALKSVGKVDQAFAFVKNTMTLDGIAHSPQGVPAMYEYRFSDPASSEFGKIDKPSFLWAGGLYLYTLYHLFGVDESEWNVSIRGPLPPANPSAVFSLAFGGSKTVKVQGIGSRLQAATVDGTELASLVLPLTAKSGTSVDVRFGTPQRPYLDRINARVHSAHFDPVKNSLTLSVSSFDGHGTRARVVALARPGNVLVNGQGIGVTHSETSEDGMTVMDIRFTGSRNVQILEIQF